MKVDDLFPMGLSEHLFNGLFVDRDRSGRVFGPAHEQLEFDFDFSNNTDFRQNHVFICLINSYGLTRLYQFLIAPAFRAGS